MRLDAWHLVIARFLEHCRARGLSPRTLEARLCALRRFRRWVRARRIASPTALTPRDLDAYAAQLTQHDDGDAPLASGTRRNLLTALRLLLRWWSAEAPGRANAAAAFVLPRRPRTLPHRGLSRRDLRQLRRACMTEHATAIRDRALIEVLLATGLRRSECCHLELQDLDLPGRWIRVCRGKGGHDRVVPISGIAVRWLRQYLRPRASADPKGAVFLSPSGHRYTSHQLGDLVRRLLDRAEITGYGACHRLRHTLATSMLENGADIRHIQAMLGHADISTTMVYASVLPLALRAVYDRTHPGVRRRHGRSFT